MASNYKYNPLLSVGFDLISTSRESPSQGRITSFSIENQASVPAGTTLTGNRTFRFSFNNPSLIQGNLTLSQDGTNLSTTISPTTTSITIAINAVTLTNTGDTTVFTLSGTNTNGDSISRSITIHVIETPTLFYHGLSSTNNPADIDLSTLTADTATTGNHTISTGQVTSGQYYIILVPSNHAIHTITDTIFNQDVTNLFTQTNNIRTISTQSYNSAVIGALNADVDGETYILNLL